MQEKATPTKVETTTQTHLSQQTLRLAIAIGFFGVSAVAFGFALAAIRSPKPATQTTARASVNTVSQIEPLSCQNGVEVDIPTHGGLMQGKEAPMHVTTYQKHPITIAEFRMRLLDGPTITAPLHMADSYTYTGILDTLQLQDGMYDAYAYLSSGGECWRSFFQNVYIYNNGLPPPVVSMPYVERPMQNPQLPYFGMTFFRVYVRDLAGDLTSASLVFRNTRTQAETEVRAYYGYMPIRHEGHITAGIDLRDEGTFEVRGKVCTAAGSCWQSETPRTLTVYAKSPEPPEEVNP